MPKEGSSCNEIQNFETLFDIPLNDELNKLGFSSISENLQYQNISTKEITQKLDAGTSLFQCRYVVTLLQFFVFFEINAYRISTSISLVAMVNQTALSSRKNFNSSIDSCPVNSSVFAGYSAPEVEGEFDWSPALQGYILGAGFLGYFVTQMPGGLLAEIYGPKIVLVCGLILSSVAHLLSPFAASSSSYLLIVMQLIRGIGQGVMPAAHSVLASNWFLRLERGLLNSLVLLGYSAGALVSSLSSGAMCSTSFLGGWPSVYYIYGVLGLVLSLCFQVFLFESPKVHPKIHSSELAYILQNQETNMVQKRPPTPWKEIFTSLPVYAVIFAMFAGFWTGAHFLSIQPIFLETILHFPIQENGFYSSIPFVFQAVFTFLGSWTSKWLNSHDYVGVDKVRKGCNLLSCVGYSFGLLGVYFAGCNRALSNFLSITAMSFVGFAYPGCMITPNDMSPTYAGTLMGLCSTIASTAAFVFPVVVGAMTNQAQTLEQWNKIFIICIGLVMSSGIMFCVFGSADVQPWNFSSVEDMDKYRISNSKDKNESQEAEYKRAVHLLS